MLKRKYHILMHTPIGDRAGTLEIQIDRDKVNGYLNVLKHAEPFEGWIDENGYCHIKGKLITLMNTIPYTATGQILPESLTLSLNGGRSIYNMTGIISREESKKSDLF